MNDATHKKIQVVGLGQACVDYLGRLSSYPLENTKGELFDLHMCCGGPASTALITLSRFGIYSSFLGSISDDYFGLEIIKNLKKERVDATFIKITPGCSSQFAFIAITQESANRTIFWHRGNVPELLKEDVDISRFPDASILHLDGLMIDASVEAAKQAKALGMTVVMDAGTLREGTWQLVSLVDILIVSESFVSTQLAPGEPFENLLHSLLELGPSQVIVTQGEKGSIGLNNEGIIRQNAFPVAAVDTTGAGDVYHGAYLYGILQEWEMAECMRFASAAAAINCKEVGAQSKTLSLKAVQDLL